MVTLAQCRSNSTILAMGAFVAALHWQVEASSSWNVSVGVGRGINSHWHSNGSVRSGKSSSTTTSSFAQGAQGVPGTPQLDDGQAHPASPAQNVIIHGIVGGRRSIAINTSGVSARNASCYRVPDILSAGVASNFRHTPLRQIITVVPLAAVERYDGLARKIH